MKLKSLVLPIVIAVFLFLFVVVNVIDIVGVFTHPAEYPFGSEFFSKYSIYRSQSLYVSYQIISTGVLVATIYFVLKQRWKLFGVLLLLDILLFIYPVLTNSLN
jgi:hypothetical protein